MKPRTRIALYGGTFDPIHRGHLEVAERVSDLFEISRVLFVPAKRPPHKVTRAVSGPIDRYAMLALATQDESRFSISQHELAATGVGYTVDTLTHFQNEFGPSADLFFLMGADSWFEIKTWREWQRVLELTNHVVVTRPGYAIESGELPPALRERLIDLRGVAPAIINARVNAEGGNRIFVTDAVQMDIAATQIREVARTDAARLVDLVPAAVASYIEKYRLYRD